MCREALIGNFNASLISSYSNCAAGVFQFPLEKCISCKSNVWFEAPEDIISSIILIVSTLELVKVYDETFATAAYNRGLVDCYFQQFQLSSCCSD